MPTTDKPTAPLTASELLFRADFLLRDASCKVYLALPGDVDERDDDNKVDAGDGTAEEAEDAMRNLRRAALDYAAIANAVDCAGGYGGPRAGVSADVLARVEGDGL